MEMYTGFWWGNLRVDGWLILKRIVKKWNGMTWNGLFLLTIEIDGGILCKR
jgi:hypothetical protein